MKFFRVGGGLPQINIEQVRFGSHFALARNPVGRRIHVDPTAKIATKI